jgi:Protein of unknown function (DUF3010)
MNICGVSLSGSVATIVLLAPRDGNLTVVGCATTRVELGDGDDPGCVRSFRDAFAALVRDHNVDVIAIKKRNTVGKFAGGAMTFKMEGLIQCMEVEVRLLAPITISSAVRRRGHVLPAQLHKYQQEAFQAAAAASDDQS